MEENQKRERERAFLEEHIFDGLENINSGFDVPEIHHFSQENFEKLLKKVQQHRIGIWGIEVWQKEFIDVTTCPDGHDPTDPWYFQAFTDFLIMREVFQYSASFYIPEHLLEKL